MIHPKLYRRISAALAAAAMLALVQPSGAAPNTWNVAAGGNWSTTGNWSLAHAPTTTDDVTFGNNSGGVFTTNDITGDVINSLIYDWSSQAQQTTVINPGKTLTVTGAGAAGSALVLVGSATTAASPTTLAPAAITGPGGNLVLSGLGDFVVHIGNGGSASTHMATLDLSGLDSLTANVGRLLVGQANSGAAVNRPSGTLILARTNNITCNGAVPQVMIQDSGSNANGGTPSVLTFGQVNFLNAPIMRLGGQKGNANIQFNSAFSSPSLKIRNSDGSSPVTTIDFGYNAAATSGNGTVLVADFSLGTVDLAANLVNIAQGNPGGSGFTGGCSGTVTLGAGTFNVSDLEIGWGNATALNGGVTAILNVNNNGLFGSGATVTANTLLRLARTNGSTGVINGTLNVTGGTVLANTIVSGGGVSTINLNSASTLVVSNTAGSLAFPIGTFSMSDTILQIPALNGSGVVAVKTLTVGGSANTIKVSSIPPIGSYPADFTLISYQGGYSPGAGPLALGTLPSASPAYAGTLVDVGGGIIQLHLTSGPVANLGMHWTGASSGDWDLSTYNWTFAGFPTNFFNGSSPLFDDTTTQTNVNLAVAVSPGAITVSNNAEAYTFSGVGNIPGAGSLTKKGSSSLTVANQGVDSIGTVIVSGGTLQIGAGGVDGEISAINFTNNGAVVVNRSGVLNLGAPIAGTGSLTKTGNGTLILSGASSYSGATTVSNGTLQVNGTLAGIGAVKVFPTAILAGGGTVTGPVTVAGQINPGSAGAPGTLTANGGLTLNSGSTLVFDLNAANAGNPALNDSVTVTGNLNLNNNTVTVNFDGAPQGGSYTLFTYSGSLVGSFNPTVLGTHFTTVIDTSTLGVVLLNVTGGSGSDLEWASTSDSTWDAVTNNWLDLATFLPSNFAAGDNVFLDDSNGVVTTITIPTGVSVAPGTITDNATNNYFTINGAGHITGSTGIVKSGPSTLTLSTANSFTGLVDIQGGTIQAGNGAALGTSTSGTTVEDGATLDINGQNIGAEVVTITGAGVSGGGALINNGGGQAQALRQIIMAGDATIGGSALLGVNNSGGAASLSTLGGSFNLTKVGANQFTMQNFTSVDPALANIDIQQGIIEFSGLTASMGDPNFTNFVAASATVSFANNSIAWNKFFELTGDGSTTTVNNGTSAATELDGQITLHGGVVFNVGGLSLTITNAISGDGGLIKNGGSPLILFGPTTFTGDTTISVGAMRLNGAADLAFSTNLTIAGGAFLTVTGMVNSTFVLYSDHNLYGSGGINGKLTANAGSTISPGVNAVGALLVSNQIVLLGTNIMELDQDNATNDVLASGLSTITYGGTLSLVNIDSPLTNGVAFKLFRATGYSGSFATIIPATPGAGQVWDTSALLTSGTIKVASATAPSFGAASFVGGNIIFHGTNGVAGTPYHVLTTTNLALPLSSWTPVVTNVFDSGGNFAYTNSANPSLPNHFYIIQVP